MYGLTDPVDRVGAVAVGDLRTVVRQADPAPATVGGHYRGFGASTVDESAAVTFVAELAEASCGSAIVRMAQGSASVLVMAGEPAPGGGRFSSFGDLDAGEDGRLLFQARLAGCEAPEGVFLWNGTEITAVARSGDPTPAGHVHRSFGKVALSSYPLDTGDYFRLAYVTTTAAGQRSLVIWPCYREPSEILTTGEPLADGTLAGFSISRLGLGMCVIARLRRGAVVRHLPLLVGEDQVIWGSQLRQGTQLPEIGRVGALMGPPAVYVHHGLVAVTLQNGETALVTRPGAGHPQVVARTGDAAPGLPGDQIQRLGPPVTNSGMPDGGVCGIAGLIRLRSGVDALWAGVFPSVQPISGAAVIPLVAGDHTDDPKPVRVNRFRPVKLTNHGTLLLRAVFDADGRPGRGLLVLDGLTDWYAHP